MTIEAATPRIVPAPTELTGPYWAAAAVGQILLQRCAECDLVWHPPAPVCPGCRSRTISWQPATGHGVLHSYTRVEHAVHAAVTAAVPYLIALVDLDEGPRIVCTLVDVDDLSSLSARTPITIGLGPAASGAQLPVARPVPVGAGDAADPSPPS